MRYFVCCFNVTPEFASTFKLQKAKGQQGEFGIKYMEAAFDRDAGSGEFFLEFEDYIWSHKLIKGFQNQGAGQVNVITFANHDGSESAANALLRVMSTQDKTSFKYTRGTCPATLLAKVQAKQAAAREASTTKEFDEKTLAALKQSVALQEETKAAVVKVEGSLQNQAVKLDGIQHGMCNVIPDYQREIEQLKQKLTHKTALCDRIEGQKGRLTYEINKLKLELEESMTEKQSLRREKVVHLKSIQELQEQVDMCKGIAMLKQMMDETQHTAEILSSTLAEARESKRARNT
jgi:hypothetical protein